MASAMIQLLTTIAADGEDDDYDNASRATAQASETSDLSITHTHTQRTANRVADTPA